MKDNLVEIKSVAQIHEMLGIEKPSHPLISLLKMKDLDFSIVPKNIRTRLDLYSIWLKDADCGMLYGRNHFDFNSGVLVFTAPGQVLGATQEEETNTSSTGWVLLFHPDLIRRSHLGQTINEYNFFNYENHEALHLSGKEEETLNDCVAKIQEEYEQRIDNHSQIVINANLNLLLSYCSRYYERQFLTRHTHHKDVVSQVEHFLLAYINSEQPAEYGAPSIQNLASEVNLSPGYLSDLLRKETGMSGKDYINHYLVEKAKNELLASNKSVSEIAYELGFNYPHYFSRVFKAKTGISPQEYRQSE